MNQEERQFSDLESNVRSYCKSFPTTFEKAKGSYIFDSEDKVYLDFFSGAGALNYGHNNDVIKSAVLDYLHKDGLIMSLDMMSKSKLDFIRTFNENILVPRGLNYKVQFTSPTGTSVVESAIKLARKVTGRQNIVCFTNAFHGMTGQSISLTGNKSQRQEVSYSSVFRIPFDGYLGSNFNTVNYLDKLIDDESSGMDLPAAVIVEVVQGEGGIKVASPQWLKDLRALTAKHGILLIVDDVQMGCGRTGTFFSFEHSEIEPDLVCLSKSIGGIGLPFALLLLKPNLDIWSTGEDNGTFRGNNLAFVASRVMLEHYWSTDVFQKDMEIKSEFLHKELRKIFEKNSGVLLDLRGLGMVYGIEFKRPADAKKVADKCFQKGLLIECCGDKNQVLKFIPALIADCKDLKKGIDIFEDSLNIVCCNEKSEHSQVEKGELV